MAIPTLLVRWLRSGSSRGLLLALIVGGMAVLASVSAASPHKDADPPQTRIVFGPGHSAGKLTVPKFSKAKFRFRSDEGKSRFQCRIDQRPWHRCSSPEVVRTRSGKHRFRVRARDRHGNLDRTAAWRVWRATRWKPDVRAARRFSTRRAGPVSFSVDLGWRSFGVRRKITAPMASTIKVMLMVAYLRKTSVRSRGLTDTEKDLIARMIQVSDNGAASAVRDMDGESAIRHLAREVGMKDFDYSPIWGICRTSARDQASFMRRIDHFIPEKHEQFALGLLGHISHEQSWGIGELAPRGWKIRFKGGWGISDGRFGGVVNHQIAQLSHGRTKIGIAMLTQGNPYTEYGQATLKGVAKRLLRGLPAGG